jgi:hypothetical protein
MNQTAKLTLYCLVVLLFGSCAKEEDKPLKENGIFINEIDANGTDWIEFYNSNSVSVSLAGFKVYDDVAEKYTIGSVSIPANGYFILVCDGSGTGGNASFRLSSEGETLYLEDGDGTLVDKITFPAIDDGSTFARFPDGGASWQLTGNPTKGITNGNAEAATISDVERVPVVPAKTDVVTVLARIVDVKGIASVKLFYRKDGGPFTLLNMVLGGSTYAATIPATNALGKIEYYIEVVNSRGVTTRHPKAAPAETEYYLLNEDLLPNLRINEFMALNSNCCPDNSSGSPEFNDWVEIYNAGSIPVDLNGYHLSDNNKNPVKFRIDGSTVLPPGGFLLIWADEQGSQGKLHANFQLAGTGEEIGLYYLDGRTIDQRIFDAQTDNVSFGRTPNGGATWRSYTSPTPGGSNQ